MSKEEGWYHIKIEYEGDTMKIFINGNEVDPAWYLSNIFPSTTTGPPITHKTEVGKK